MNENRTIYGYLNRPFNNTVNAHGKVEKGLITVLFEEVDRTITPINSEKFFDDREEVFLLDGFETLSEKYDQKVLKINAIENTNDHSEGQTNYVTFKNQISDVNKNNFASILEASLPDPLHLAVSLPETPHTKVFFIKEENDVFGPFALEKYSEIGIKFLSNEGKLKPLSGKANGFGSLKVGYIFKFDYEELKSALNEKLVSTPSGDFIIDLQSIHKAHKRVVEFFTQQNIVEFFGSLANKRVIQQSVAQIIKKELNTMSLGEVSKDAIRDVVRKASDDNSVLKNQLFEIIETEERGQVLLEKMVASQSNKFEERWKLEAIEKNKEIKADIDQNKNALKTSEENIQLAHKELAQLERKIEEKLSKLEQESGFAEELKQKKLKTDEELETKRQEISELTEKYRDYKELEDLQTKLQELRDDLKSEQRRELTLESTINKLKKQIAEEDAVLQSKLRDMVPYVSSIIQAPIPSKEKQISFSEQSLNVLDAEDDLDLASKIINGVCTQFHQKYDRDYSPETIASFLVANFQNFITIFAGAPGIGKTSFVRLFNQIVGLDERFKEIAVGKSWTSEREFIGFYNSLTDSFSPSPSGVYQYLKGVEQDLDKDSTYQLILLDEANLSPIEHYAAILLNIADTESAKKIPVGKSEITLPNTLRVIGTVNHDMTTESLSARLLDRAPVIPFESILSAENNTQHEQVDLDLTISKSVFARLFGIDSSIKSDDVSFDSLESVINKLCEPKPELGIPFIVSKRKQKAVNNYISVLTPILRQLGSFSFDEALVKAVDYACLYFILPSINGNGSGLKTRLTQLQEIMQENSLAQSANKLDDMLRRGEYHLDTFNFFTY